MKGPIRFTGATRTTKEWARFANAVPDVVRREQFILDALNASYKAGYEAGMKHKPGEKLPWEDV